MSMGNKLDLDEIDYLRYLVQDPKTEMIGLYLESIGKGRELLEIARGTSKPILLHKANTGEQSRKIAKLHTAALANDDAIVDEALRQAGIVRVRDFRSFVNAVRILSLPPMKGNNLVVISRSGGIAIVAADTAETNGFRLYPLSRAIQNRIHSYFRAKVIRPTNPIDLGDLFDFELYVKILEDILKIKAVDGILFQHGAVSEEREPSRRLIGALKELSFRYEKPVALCYLTDEEESATIKKIIDYPIFSEPHEALSALAISRDHYRRQMARKGKPPSMEVDRDQVSGIFERAKREKRDPLLPEAFEVLEAYGIRVAKYQVVHLKKDLKEAIGKVGDFLAMKIVSPGVSHKSDVGGVILNLGNLQETEKAYGKLKRLSRGEPLAVLAQKMVQGGKEIILGAKRDPSFGPVVLLGLGGIYVEVLRDTSLRVAPINRSDAEEMISELKGAALLKGVRGERPGGRGRNR